MRRALCHCSYAPGMRRKFQEGTLLGLRLPRACLSHCGSDHSAANMKQLFIQQFSRNTSLTHKQFIHVHISYKGYSSKSNADADISQTCQLHMCSTDQQYSHTTPNSIKGIKTHANTISPFFCKLTMEGSCCPHDWWFCQHEAQKSSNWCFPSGLNNFHWQLR